MTNVIDDFEVRVGDALEELERLPDECVQMCVCSPPYWGLRDYGVDGQLGLEPTPEEYVEKLVEVFGEVRRVLREDGTVWLNLGDSYAANRSYQVSDQKHEAHDYGDSNAQQVPPNLKQKDMVGIPWRVAFALQSDGWWLRSDIIWRKPNPMPESVTDRPTSSHEHIFLFAKSEQYYYDHEAIKEDTQTNNWTPAKGQNKNDGEQTLRNDGERHGGGQLGDPSGRNKRDVWEVTTKPYPDAHFAVYPPDLIVPCVRAGTSQRGQCVECGEPWEREVERSPMEMDASPNREAAHEAGSGNGRRDTRGTMTKPPESATVGWAPTCDCGADTEPQLVLDPFAGAGTTGVVCTELGRRFLGIELNDEYAEMARERIMETNPTLFRETA